MNKKSIFFIFPLWCSLLGLSSLTHAMQMHTQEDARYLVPQFRLGFSPREFLRSQKIALPQSDKAINETCWKTLFDLKDAYKKNNDAAGRVYTYMIMAKFLLDFRVYPENVDTAIKQEQFLSQFITKLGNKLLPDNANSVAEKWLHIYLGLLFEKFGQDYRQGDARLKYFAKAMASYEKAFELSTTRTAYLAAARLILAHVYAPKTMSLDEAKDLALAYLDKSYETISAHESPEGVSPTTKSVKSNLSKSIKDFARPPYIRKARENVKWREQAIELDDQPSEDHLMQPEGEHHGRGDVEIEIPLHDELENFDFAQIRIPQMDAHGLAIHSEAFNTVGVAKNFYH